MSLGLSPSIEYNENSFINAVEQVANRFAGMVGKFPWGAVDERVLVSNEQELINQFLAPTEDNYKDWFSAKNYLDYNNKLYVVRSIAENGSFNSGLTCFSEVMKVLNHGTVTGSYELGETITGGTSSATGTLVMISDGALIVKVLTGVFEEAETLTGGTSSAVSTSTTIDDDVINYKNPMLKKNFDDNITVTSETFQAIKFIARYCGSYGDNIEIAIANSTDFATPTTLPDTSKGYISGTSTFKDNFEFSPSTNEIAIAILLNGEIIEKHIVSLIEGNKNYRGQNNYIETYLENNSNLVYAYHNTNYTSILSQIATSLLGGNANSPTASDVISSYNLFSNSDEIDVDVIFDGANMDLDDGATIIQHIIDNILEKNKLMRGVFGATENDLVGVANDSLRASNLQTYFNDTLNRTTSFGAFYGEYKYQKDIYNDKYRWIPISGDMAGLYAVSEAFEAPAGVTRGRIKNCIKLAFNPSEAFRDTLNPKGINTIYNVRNTGFVCMSQKTMKVDVPTPFSRVETRGLFILLRKATVNSSLYYLFQKHTPALRRRFISDVEPYFRRLQGMDAIEDYLIVCDENNNPAEVRDNHMFIANFYVKPFNSVEWIKLNFTATQSNVNFEELIVANPTI